MVFVSREKNTLTLVKVFYFCSVYTVMFYRSEQSHIMSKLKSLTIWFYILFIPSISAILGLSIAFIADTFDWGSKANIPVALLVGLFFAELTMVISGLGIVAFIKSKPKTAIIKAMGLWNILILIVAAVTGYNIFMVL